jgi:hypothetical protein
MAQMVLGLPSEHKALSTKSQYWKKRKKERKKRRKKEGRKEEGRKKEVI